MTNHSGLAEVHTPLQMLSHPLFNEFRVSFKPALPPITNIYTTDQ